MAPEFSCSSFLCALDLQGLGTSSEVWKLGRLGIWYQVNAHFGDIALSQFPGTSSLTILQHRSNVICFIFRDVDGDVLGSYGILIFTRVCLEIMGETFVDFHDIMRARVSLSKLGIPVVRD